MSIYAELDCSIIDELPPGRQAVQTLVLEQSRRENVIARLAVQCRRGCQAYWVCTLIEESEHLQCQAAEACAAFLGEQLPELQVGLVHGRMSAQEKVAVMSAFKTGVLQVLVATTVIEVGVDVPNASIMVIENPERLGLAQLHQLRGRVGRGAQESFCVLLYQKPLSWHSYQRLNIMRETSDGFVIAEKDLALRGPGEILGARQTGLAQLKIADLVRDQALLEWVARCAEALLSTVPDHTQVLIKRWLPQGHRLAFA